MGIDRRRTQSEQEGYLFARLASRDEAKDLVFREVSVRRATFPRAIRRRDQRVNGCFERKSRPDLD